jgi:hypothetical protein
MGRAKVHVAAALGVLMGLGQALAADGDPNGVVV